VILNLVQPTLTSFSTTRVLLSCIHVSRLRSASLRLLPRYSISSAILVFPPLLQEDLELARTRLLLAQSQQAAGLNDLQPFLRLAQSQGRKTSAIRILLVQALLMQAQGSLTRALSPLSQALSLAEPAGFIRIFVDEGASLRSLLLALRDTTTAVSQHYIARLLAELPPETPLDALEQNAPADEAFSLRDPLSERELEILRLIASGRSNQEITVHLVIALSTLKTHINRMYNKLGVSSRTQALVRARRLRLL
jgi:LuxR family maltose regulon positive regulatory protein